MVIRLISRLISGRKRRKIRSELNDIYQSILYLNKWALEALDEVKRYHVLMQLYDESEPEYSHYKVVHDLALERAKECRQEVDRRSRKAKRLMYQLDRLSE